MFIIDFFKAIIKGFYFLCSLLTKGFYFYPKQFFIFLKKIFNIKFFDKIINFYEKRQKQPEFCLLLVIYFIAFTTVFKIVYVKPQEVVKNDVDFDINEDINIRQDDEIIETDEDVQDNQEIVENEPIDNSNNNSSFGGIVIDNNPYRIFSKTSLNDVNILDLKNRNSDTIAWISVDGTNINYPVVKTDNNDFYLDHSFDKSYKKTGWIFMDYRNDNEMGNYNTIFYGHNLLNKTAFGSIGNIFESNWVNTSNHTIIVLTDKMQYVYKIFSAYYIDPEIYYLNNTFSSVMEYQTFLNTISSRNIINIDNSVSVDDKIITLSTCTEDNKGRKVVHAKLISSSERS